MRKAMLILAILLPFIFMVGFMARSEYQIRHGTLWEIDIQGYDPRDILKGHYIDYRYRWNWDNKKLENFMKRKVSLYEENCLCLEENESSIINPVVYPIECNENVKCKAKLKGHLVGNLKDNNFITGIEKFYIAEKKASSLERALRTKKASIQFRINHQGRAVLVDLFLDGKNWQNEIEQ